MRLRAMIVLGSVVLLALCALQAGSQMRAAGAITVFEGARLIVGDGSAPIENAVFLVQNNRFTGIGAKGRLKTPAGAHRVDLSGKTVIPALVDDHVHLGYRMA